MVILIWYFLTMVANMVASYNFSKLFKQKKRE